MKKLTLLLASFMWMGAAHATTIINGSFETGDLSGWFIDPTVVVDDVTGPAGDPQTPTDGDHMAKLTPNNGGNGFELECILLGDLSYFNCAYMVQFLEIDQYDTINFDWNFRDRESNSDGNAPDAAFYLIGNLDANSGLQFLADAAGAGSGWTGWNSASYYHAGASGAGIIGFAIANYGDGENSSRLLIDNVHVPEPGSLALLAMGLLGLGFSRKRIS